MSEPPKVYKVSEKRRAQTQREFNRIRQGANIEMLQVLEPLIEELGIPINVQPPYQYDEQKGEFRQATAGAPAPRPRKGNVRAEGSPPKA